MIVNYGTDFKVYFGARKNYLKTFLKYILLNEMHVDILRKKISKYARFNLNCCNNCFQKKKCLNTYQKILTTANHNNLPKYFVETKLKM